MPAAKKPKAGPGRGHKAEITKETKDLILALAGYGAPVEYMASMTGLSATTIKTRCKKELARGKGVANTLVKESLFKSARGGNVTAQIFWLKNREPDEWKDRIAVGGDPGSNPGGRTGQIPVVWQCIPADLNA
jgi:hypothetical protein